MQFDDVVGYHLLIGVWTGEFIQKNGRIVSACRLVIITMFRACRLVFVADEKTKQRCRWVWKKRHPGMFFAHWRGVSDMAVERETDHYGQPVQDIRPTFCHQSSDSERLPHNGCRTWRHPWTVHVQWCIANRWSRRHSHTWAAYTPFTRGSIHEAYMKQTYSIYTCTCVLKVCSKFALRLL